MFCERRIPGLIEVVAYGVAMMIGVMKDTELLESWVIISIIIIISFKHKLRSSEG
ncbi:hypothetical protein BKA82DRAFT_4189709, partial [Pisolithus tinctorius]